MSKHHCLILIYVPVFQWLLSLARLYQFEFRNGRAPEETAKIRGGISNEWKVDGGVEQRREIDEVGNELARKIGETKGKQNT